MAPRKGTLPNHEPWEKKPDKVPESSPNHTANLFREHFPTHEANPWRNLTNPQYDQLRGNDPMLQPTQRPPTSQFTSWDFLRNTDPAAPNLRTRTMVPPGLEPRTPRSAASSDSNASFRSAAGSPTYYDAAQELSTPDQSHNQSLQQQASSQDPSVYARQSAQAPSAATNETPVPTSSHQEQPANTASNPLTNEEKTGRDQVRGLERRRQM